MFVHVLLESVRQVQDTYCVHRVCFGGLALGVGTQPEGKPRRDLRHQLQLFVSPLARRHHVPGWKNIYHEQLT